MAEEDAVDAIVETGDFVTETGCRVRVVSQPETAEPYERQEGVYLLLVMEQSGDGRRAELKLTRDEAVLLGTALTSAGNPDVPRSQAYMQLMLRGLLGGEPGEVREQLRQRFGGGDV